MSHDGTAWAFHQPAAFPDMKPGELCVLLALADCHNPAKGCFPSLDYIQKVTNLSERGVRDQLTRLRERGLINWATARKDGHRDNNRYSLAFEEGFRRAEPLADPAGETGAMGENADGASVVGDGEQPANFAGSPYRQETGEQPADSGGATGKLLPVDNKEGTVRRTVREPLRESAGAREGDETPEPPHLPDADLLAKLRAAAPTAAQDSVADTDAAWRRLTREERREAVERHPEWLADAKRNGRGKIAGLPTYLAEKRWTMLPARAGGATAADSAGRVPAFSRSWFRLCWRAALHEPPNIELIRQKAGAAKSFGGGWLIAPAERERLDEEAKALIALHVDSAAVAAWRVWCRKRGFELPLPDAAQWIYAPGPEPPTAPQDEDIGAVVMAMGGR
jgi:hypothetical protein